MCARSTVAPHSSWNFGPERPNSAAGVNDRVHLERAGELEHAVRRREERQVD
jgi:hypothetical protein